MVNSTHTISQSVKVFIGWRYNMSSFQKKRRFSMVYPMANTDVFIIFQYTDGYGYGWIVV